MTNKGTVVLVVAPHPDDEVLGVGGTIARHIALGDEVHVGILTKGNTSIFTRQSIDQVRQEALEAHRRLGVTRTHFCDHLPAPGLDTVADYEIAAVISAWLSECRPVTLYLPHRGDVHQDHRAACHAALVAARPGYSSVTRILCYETLSETEWSGPFQEAAFLPNVFVEITPWLNTKKDAMRAYQSQLKSFPNPRSIEGIEALAHVRGSTCSLNAAEAFVLVREIVPAQGNGDKTT